MTKQAISDPVYVKDATIEVETIDKYSRTVGKVLVGGVDANLRPGRLRPVPRGQTMEPFAYPATRLNFNYYIIQKEEAIYDP